MTHDTGRRQTKHKNIAQKSKKMSNMYPTKNPEVNPGAGKVPAAPAS